ncbi:MAG: tryptophan-rich sensory protein [Rhizobiaceae bacterium]|nr:MAG: tryptophan-rich sensory protein [Rhizobiaceae bacterium]CAG0999838.1 Tryptophan-rich sensory protein [Rhizobiaceae bacterium]
MRNRISLVVFLVVVIGGGLAIGSVTRPDGWYAALAKPSFNPPNWIFAPVWTILYVLVAVAGWRTFRRDAGGAAMKLWAAQLVLNFLWSPVFFAAHWIGAALAVVSALLVTILAFVAATWVVDRPAAWMFVPYAAWVAFAALLNASILVLN